MGAVPALQAPVRVALLGRPAIDSAWQGRGRDRARLRERSCASQICSINNVPARYETENQAKDGKRDRADAPAYIERDPKTGTITREQRWKDNKTTGKNLGITSPLPCEGIDGPEDCRER